MNNLESKFEELIFNVYFNFFSNNNKLLFDLGDMNKINSNKNQMVLFPLIYGARCSEMILQTFIAKSLNLRGVSTVFVLCDKKLPICLEETLNKKRNCFYCYNIGKKFSSFYGNLTYWVGDFISKKDSEEANKIVYELKFDDYSKYIYRNINVGLFAESATKRFLQKGIIGKSELEKSVFSNYLESAILHVNLAEKINSIIKPTHIILSNIAYIPGIFVEYFNMNDVKCIASDFGILKSTINLNELNFEKKSLYHVSDKTWKKYKNIELEKGQIEELNKLFIDRRKGKGMYLDYGKFTDKKSNNSLIKALKTNPNSKFVLYSNLIWDASLSGADLVFENQLEWIEFTINYFHETEDVLIIKVHPAENIVGTHQSILEFIYSSFSELPSNIMILPPETTISTYDLFDLVDCGIVYTSTTGLEMAAAGIPVIVAGETHYRHKGFTFDIYTEEDYLYYMKNIKSIQMDKMMKDLALKYSYLHFIDRNIPFNFIDFHDEYFASPFLNIKNIQDLEYNKNESLDLICDGIMNGKEILRSGVFK